MALLVYYKKTRETETEVEYHYGHSEPEMDVRVVLDKADRTGPPTVGTRDPICQHVVRRVRGLQVRQMVWPEGGVIQS
jgi:hypothetical protein